MVDALERVLDATYAVATDANAWPTLLQRLAELFRCHFADAFVRSGDFTSYRGIVHGLDPADYQDGLLDTWVKRNVWSQVRPVQRAGDVLTTRDMVAPQTLMRSEMYCAYLGPRDLSEGLRLDIWAGDGWVQDVSLIRSWSAGPYEPHELAMARRVLPHLQRAAEVGRRLDDAASLAGAGLAALDAVRRPAIVADAAGEVLHANRAGEAMLASADLDRLLGLLGRAAHENASARFTWPHDRGAQQVIALPLAPGGRFAVRAPSVLLLAEERPDPPQQQWAERFGLTQAESGVASLLLAGRNAAEIAEATGRSINTVRSHMARLMFKTGTRRQATLVQALSGRSLERPNLG